MVLQNKHVIRVFKDFTTSWESYKYWKISLSEILKNEEINTIIHTIGAGVGADFELKDCEYDKVIIMTDADTDGAHIQTLLLTFFSVICAL